MTDLQHTTQAYAATPPNPTDEASIRAVVDRASRAQNDRDLLIALHRSDAVVVNFPGRRVLGRTALNEAMGAALATPLQDVRTEVEVLDIRMINEDTVLVSCVKTVHDQRSNPGDLPASRGSLTYVLTRFADDWRIALAQTTPILG